MPAHALTYNRSRLYSAVHTLEPCSARSKPHLVLRHALPLEFRDGKREWAADVRAPGARLEWRVRVLRERGFRQLGGVAGASAGGVAGPSGGRRIASCGHRNGLRSDGERERR